MNEDTVGWSHRYEAALRKHLRQSAIPNLRSMALMGRRASSIGVEIQDVAIIHKNAIARLKSIDTGGKFYQRAEDFCAAAITSIMKARFVGRKSPGRLGKLNKTLGRRKAGLDTANRTLLEDIARSKSTEAALKKNGDENARRLNESAQLQTQLRQLTHRMMAAQEDDRMQISQELQNEIAQSLLGINVRLLSLKKLTRSSNRDFKKGISSTQQLVLKSAKSVRKFARQLDAIQKESSKERDELMRESAKRPTAAIDRIVHGKSSKPIADRA